ncbi:keto-hydroxyglutarate-aldolase/keto-deoxy-phosphogluconate aldolase [Streptococcus parauberis]|uniref:hydrolase n=1 Tax=Streptococcus parauberis TaxID=1348 RepID=UPI000CCF093C|nr:hydrolase [Streptococcus parauberis]PNY21621.1 keto-hydroxyglutarate-aldolase/keto-deoxy-phosphogluconate aldolase [Streptococcus parauberis]
MKISKENAPNVMSDLRKEIVRMPDIIRQCSGIYIYGRRIRSVLFSTDVSVIANHNADAILAVYPFTPTPTILKSIMLVSSVPVFAGVGGGLTTGYRSANMSLFSESEGAYAVVVNAPTKVDTISHIEEIIDIPIIYTVVSEETDIKSRIEAGVDILNVSGGVNTPTIVRKIREEFPHFPIMATGGPSEETILEVIEAGANAITITPPTNGQLFRAKMEKYRVSQKD